MRLTQIKGESKTKSIFNPVLSTANPQSSRASYMSLALGESVYEGSQGYAQLGKRDLLTDDEGLEEVNSKRIHVLDEDII